MTLRYDKNSIMDNRKVEYEQSIVRLGLEKAAFEKEVGQIRQEIDELCDRRVEVKESIETLITESSRAQKVLEDVQAEIADAVHAGGEKVAALRTEEVKGQENMGGKKLELQKLEEYLLSLTEQIDTKIKKRAEFEENARQAHVELVRVRSELNSAKRELEEVSSEIKVLYQLKLEVTSKLTTIDVERQEIEEIVSVLKESNKEGLELVASFEGERKRLQEKDDFLRRKEADLAIYENRLKKRMDDAGYDVKMTFK